MVVRSLSFRAKRGICSFVSGSTTVVALTLCAHVATAQTIGSEPRSITLHAFKRPAFETLDAVRIVAQRVAQTDSAGYEARAVVEVRVDMQCEIRMTALGHRPVTVYQGECRASDAKHPVSLRLAERRSVAITYEVIGTVAGATRRWVAESPAVTAIE